MIFVLGYYDAFGYAKACSLRVRGPSNHAWKEWFQSGAYAHLLTYSNLDCT